MADGPATARASPTKTETVPAAAPGADNPRWPGAPERVFEDGECVNAEFTCSACGAASTLVYRCSECGAPASGSGGQATGGERT